MTEKQEYMIKKYCPNCYQELVVRYDFLKMETTCKWCGLVLRAPPAFGIVYPEVIIRKIKIEKNMGESR